MKLKDYLEEYGITQLDFAAKCGISPAIISTLLSKSPGDVYLTTALRILKGSDGLVVPEDLVSPQLMKRRLRRVVKPVVKKTKKKD